jgi:hypothetical protein
MPKSDDTCQARAIKQITGICEEVERQAYMPHLKTRSAMFNRIEKCIPYALSSQYA